MLFPEQNHVTTETGIPQESLYTNHVLGHLSHPSSDAYPLKAINAMKHFVFST